MSKKESIRQLFGEGNSVLETARKAVVTEPYVRKIMGFPNPVESDEYKRKYRTLDAQVLITNEIYDLYEEKFITPDHTAGFIEALITMTDARQILELGMYSGYGTLHMIRAILGKEGAKVTSIDCDMNAPDWDFFGRPQIVPWFHFVPGATPDILSQLTGIFDLVFVDSNHSLDHTQAELSALMPITRPGSILLFHDCPKEHGPIYGWLNSKVADGTLKGLILPTAPQPDVTAMHGRDNLGARPNLGVFMRA